MPTNWCACSATAGLRVGDGVALLCSNRAEFADVWAACQRGGFRLTTVNWHLTGDEAAYIVTDCEAKVFVAEVAMADVARAAVGDHAKPAAAVVGRRRDRGVHASRRGPRRCRRLRHRRPEPRHRNAVHEWHDRATQGSRPARGPRRVGDGLGAVRVRRRAPRPPLHRPAVSRRAVFHLSDLAADGRCPTRPDGGMGRRGVSPAHRCPPRESHPCRAHDVPPHVGAARRRSSTLRLVVTARRRARSRTLPRSR